MNTLFKFHILFAFALTLVLGEWVNRIDPNEQHVNVFGCFILSVAMSLIDLIFLISLL